MSEKSVASLPRSGSRLLDLHHIGLRMIVIGPLIAVAGGRWGSYLGLPGVPIYFSDLSVFLGVLFVLLSRLDTRSAALRMSPPPIPRALLVGSFCAGAIFLIGALRSPGFSIFAIRDSLPFVYFLLIPVFYRAIESLGRERAFRWLRNALLLHLLWFAPAVFKILPSVTIPLIGGTAAFQPRGDFDLLIGGLTVVVIAMDRRMPSLLRGALCLVGSAAILFNGSRAGLISAVVLIAVVALLERPFSDAKKGPIRLAVTALAAAPLLLIVVAVTSAPPEWAVALQKLVPNSSSVYQSGQNTWTARLDAWALLINYSIDHGSTAWLGFGFGANPVLNSGAVRYLSGDPSVRAAHDNWVTWFAMVGLVGLCLAIVAFAGWLGLAIRRAIKYRGLNSIGLGLAIGLLSAASAGVILESPFGYMTMALAIALASQRGIDQADPRTQAQVSRSNALPQRVAESNG
ncbi:O-antigen ligase family protein [Herbiconiux sp. 11R-BC]|uniref:O-antigen ligase family protein n=1 Tax=Herbiconiux sp. 11R-BC TaxID=3111637 RepID=UPI003C07981A